MVLLRQKKGVPCYPLVFAPVWMEPRWGRLSAWHSTLSPGEQLNHLLTSTIETAWPMRMARSTHMWVNLSTWKENRDYDSRFKWWFQSSGPVSLYLIALHFFLQDVPLGQYNFQQRSERSVFLLFIALYI